MKSRDNDLVCDARRDTMRIATIGDPLPLYRVGDAASTEGDCTYEELDFDYPPRARQKGGTTEGGADSSTTSRRARRTIWPWASRIIPLSAGSSFQSPIYRAASCR